MSETSSTPTVAAARALEWIHDGMTLGLGTGRAAAAFVDALGQCVQERNWKIRAVASSQATAERARALGIPLVELEGALEIDLTVDGADEIDPDGQVIKGLGGALFREKILALCSRRWVLCVGAEKRVGSLGAHGILPVEVVPFALPFCLTRLRGLGLDPAARRTGSSYFMTDNGNYICDCRITQIEDAQKLQDAIRAIPGVLETGLFLNLCPIVVTERPGGVEIQDYSVT